MADADSGGYQKLQVIRGGLVRRAHDVVCQTPVPKEHRAYLYDLRRQRRHIYGSLLHFLGIAAKQGVPKHVLKQIPQWIDAFIDDLYDPNDQRAA